MENYSRKEKNNSTSNRKPASQHIKTGFSALQKTIATIASLLSIVIACFTIMNLMNNNDSKSKTDTGNSTTTTTSKRQKKSLHLLARLQQKLLLLLRPKHHQAPQTQKRIRAIQLLPLTAVRQAKTSIQQQSPALKHPTRNSIQSIQESLNFTQAFFYFQPSLTILERLLSFL